MPWQATVGALAGWAWFNENLREFFGHKPSPPKDEPFRRPHHHHPRTDFLPQPILAASVQYAF